MSADSLTERADLAGERDSEGRCITCSDEARPMRVLEPPNADLIARCEGDEGRVEDVEVTLVHPVSVGEVLLVHAGTALARERCDAVRAGEAQMRFARGRRR